MIAPGVYEHYKNHKHYRALMCGMWRGAAPALDGTVYVVVGGLRHDATLSIEVHAAAPEARR